MDENEFETAADRTLQALMTRIEETLGDELDVDLRGGILTVEFDDGRQYVINKHASPVSGASHYAYDGAWRSTRDGAGLAQRLAEELGALTGTEIRFD
ncbi:MAG: iron donor protein CyaY [Rhodospirillales bacterium]|nr:iron donor protein CyaY [Rhodospirillales bacterium]